MFRHSTNAYIKLKKKIKLITFKWKQKYPICEFCLILKERSGYLKNSFKIYIYLIGFRLVTTDCHQYYL